MREVELDVDDLAGEHCRYRISFADEAARSAGFDFLAGEVRSSLGLDAVEVASVGSQTLPDLTGASITQITSTSVTINCGITPSAGHGVEVRRSNFAWGKDNDRNLVGRFTTQTFDVPRLARVQDYYLRQYDSSSPAKYSRYTTALHVDWQYD